MSETPSNGTAPAGAPPPEPPRPHVFIATPCYGGMVTLAYHNSMVQLITELQARQIPSTRHMTMGSSLIVEARNRSVRDFLREPGATHLFFIDSDQGFTPGLLFDLLRADKDVIGSVVAKKTVNWPLVNDLAKQGYGDLARFSSVYSPPPPLVGQEVDGGPMYRAKAVGSGAMLIKRNVCERMWERYYDELWYVPQEGGEGSETVALFNCVVEKGYMLGEDYSFCHRWRAMGGDVWVWLGSPVSHVGNTEYRGMQLSVTLHAGEKPAFDVHTPGEATPEQIEAAAGPVAYQDMGAAGAPMGEVAGPVLPVAVPPAATPAEVAAP